MNENPHIDQQQNIGNEEQFSYFSQEQNDMDDRARQEQISTYQTLIHDMQTDLKKFNQVTHNDGSKTINSLQANLENDFDDNQSDSSLSFEDSFDYEIMISDDIYASLDYMSDSQLQEREPQQISNEQDSSINGSGNSDENLITKAFKKGCTFLPSIGKTFYTKIMEFKEQNLSLNAQILNYQQMKPNIQMIKEYMLDIYSSSIVDSFDENEFDISEQIETLANSVYNDQSVNETSQKFIGNFNIFDKAQSPWHEYIESQFQVLTLLAVQLGLQIIPKNKELSFYSNFDNLALLRFDKPSKTYTIEKILTNTLSDEQLQNQEIYLAQIVSTSLVRAVCNILDSEASCDHGMRVRDATIVLQDSQIFQQLNFKYVQGIFDTNIEFGVRQTQQQDSNTQILFTDDIDLSNQCQCKSYILNLESPKTQKQMNFDTTFKMIPQFSEIIQLYNNSLSVLNRQFQSDYPILFMYTKQYKIFGDIHVAKLIMPETIKQTLEYKDFQSIAHQTEDDALNDIANQLLDFFSKFNFINPQTLIISNQNIKKYVELVILKQFNSYIFITPQRSKQDIYKQYDTGFLYFEDGVRLRQFNQNFSINKKGLKLIKEYEINQNSLFLTLDETYPTFEKAARAFKFYHLVVNHMIHNAEHTFIRKIRKNHNKFMKDQQDIESESQIIDNICDFSGIIPIILKSNNNQESLIFDIKIVTDTINMFAKLYSFFTIQTKAQFVEFINQLKNGERILNNDKNNVQIRLIDMQKYAKANIQNDQVLDKDLMQTHLKNNERIYDLFGSWHEINIYHPLQKQIEVNFNSGLESIYQFRKLKEIRENVETINLQMKVFDIPRQHMISTPFTTEQFELLLKQNMIAKELQLIFNAQFFFQERIRGVIDSTQMFTQLYSDQSIISQISEILQANMKVKTIQDDEMQLDTKDLRKNKFNLPLSNVDDINHIQIHNVMSKLLSRDSSDSINKHQQKYIIGKTYVPTGFSQQTYLNKVKKRQVSKEIKESEILQQLADGTLTQQQADSIRWKQNQKNDVQYIEKCSRLKFMELQKFIAYKLLQQYRNKLINFLQSQQTLDEEEHHTLKQQLEKQQKIYQDINERYQDLKESKNIKYQLIKQNTLIIDYEGAYENIFFKLATIFTSKFGTKGLSQFIMGLFRHQTLSSFFPPQITVQNNQNKLFGMICEMVQYNFRDHGYILDLCQFEKSERWRFFQNIGSIVLNEIKQLQQNQNSSQYIEPSFSEYIKQFFIQKLELIEDVCLKAQLDLQYQAITSILNKIPQLPGLNLTKVIIGALHLDCNNLHKIVQVIRIYTSVSQGINYQEFISKSKRKNLKRRRNFKENNIEKRQKTEEKNHQDKQKQSTVVQRNIEEEDEQIQLGDFYNFYLDEGQQEMLEQQVEDEEFYIQVHDNQTITDLNSANDNITNNIIIANLEEQIIEKENINTQTQKISQSKKRRLKKQAKKQKQQN
eukprot:403342136